MSGIILRWVNQDLFLKQRVLNLEHDFSNGYLLGEILHLHNHQQNFHLFQESGSADAKITNFLMLEPSLRLLGVRFDAQVAYAIMQARPGVAAQLLYQLKMILDKLAKSSAHFSMTMTTRDRAGVKRLPNLPQRPTKPQYDKATHAIFAAAVRDMVQSQNVINTQRSLQRFAAEGARQKRLAQVEKERSLIAEDLRKEAIRQQGLQNSAQRKALCLSWEDKNVEAWLINMARKRDRVQRNNLFLRKIERARMARLHKSVVAAERAVSIELPEFEARSREAVQTASGNNQEEHETAPWALTASRRGYLEVRALEKGYQWQLAKFRAKRLGHDAGIDVVPSTREERRRRFMTEREQSLWKESLQERTESLAQKLMRRCKAEEQVDQQLQVIRRYKDIMVENRKYRMQQYAARADVDAGALLKPLSNQYLSEFSPLESFFQQEMHLIPFELSRDQASFDSRRRDYELGVQAQSERYTAAKRARAAASATRTEKLCRETLDRMIILALEVVGYRAYSESSQEPDAIATSQDPIPRLQWIDMKRVFVRGGPLLRMDSAGVSFEDSARKDWGRKAILPLVPTDSGGGDSDLSGRDADVETREDVSAMRTTCMGDNLLLFRVCNSRSKTASPPDVATFLDKSDFRDYINDEGWWATQVETTTSCGERLSMGSDTGETNPVDRHTHDVDTLSSLVKTNGNGNISGKGSALETADPYHALGECVIDTWLAANPLSSPPPTPAVPRFSVRICMGGRTFAGKSEQAIRLADRYCLKVLSVEKLVQRAIDNADSAIAAGRKDLSNDETLGQEAGAALMQGGTIPDEVYAALLVQAITEIEDYNVAGVSMVAPEDHRAGFKGWIIDDFPNSAKQAAVLERLLSGFDEAAHIPSRNDAASRLAPFAPTSPPEAMDNNNNKLLHGGDFLAGVDLLVYIDVPQETIFKRCLGRLQDPVTAESYHLNGALPEYDVVCKERLIRPEDPSNPSAQVFVQVVAQDELSQGLKAFGAKLWALRTVDSGEETTDALFGKVNVVVMDMIQQIANVEKKEEVSEVCDQDVVPDAVADGQEGSKFQYSVVQDVDVVGENETDDICSAGTPGDKLTRSEKKQEEQEKQHEQKHEKELEAGTIDATSSDLGQSHSGGLSSSVEEEEVPAPQNCKDDKGIVLTGDLAAAVSGHWRLAEVQFEETALRVFRELRNQRLLIGAHVHSLRDSFAVFLQQQDDKQDILEYLCVSFNSINQDLRFDDRARKELLLRTEECRSRLWSDVEARKQCASKALANIKADGWLGQQQDVIVNCIMVLMQAEVERFHAGMCVLHDYYHAKRQEAIGEDTIFLALLLPPESQEDSSKDVQTAKPVVNKCSKDKKGGKQGGTSGKNKKYISSKGDPTQQTRSIGRRTPFPPCLILPYLHGVTGAESCTQVEGVSAELAAATAPGKKKPDKGKKPRDKVEKVVGKGYAPEADEARPSLDAAMSVVLEYSSSWGPEGFPVGEDDAASLELHLQSQPETQPEKCDHNGGFSAMSLPSPFLLHRAVWAQAKVLATRCRQLRRAGKTLTEAVQKKIDLVHRELERSLSVRVTEEEMAVEAAMAMARTCIDTNKPIEHHWKLEGISFTVDETIRSVPACDDRPQYTTASTASKGKDAGGFDDVHAGRLRDALELVQHNTSSGDSQDALVMTHDVVDVFLRLAEEDGALPECWADVTKTEMMQVIARVMDKDDVGQVTVEKIVSTAFTSLPQDLLLN